MYKGLRYGSITPNTVKSFVLDKFLGVDLTRGDYITDTRRSPSAVNTIWGGNPHVFSTRTGLMRLSQTLLTTNDIPDAIYGIHVYEPDNEVLVHAGTKLYLMSGVTTGTNTYTLLYSGLTAAKSVSFMMNGNLYILGGVYVVYNGVSVSAVAGDDAYVPTTVIGRAPTGGGTVYEGVNMLSKWRINQFAPVAITQEVTDEFTGNSSDDTFTLSVTSGITNDVIQITVNGSVIEDTEYTVSRVYGTVTFTTAPATDAAIEVTYRVEDVNNPVYDTVYQLDDTGLDDEDIVVTINDVEIADTEYTFDHDAGTVTFDTAPEPAAGREGVDNVYIQFAKTVTGHSAIVNGCTICGIFGGESDTRVFIGGNASYPNRDYHSGLSEPTYFPDNGYTDVGNNNTELMGYLRQYDTQMPIKESNQQDGTAFLRTFALTDNNEPYFPLEQGSVGIGAVSKYCFGYLNGDPLFLSSQGVMRVRGTDVDNQRLIQPQSEHVDTLLTRESNLENAIACEHQGKYYLFVNGHGYVADARMRYTDSLGNAQYEWMYWEGVNASAAVSFGDYLLVGYNGAMFRFKSESDASAFIDEDYNGTESDIVAYWTTPKLIFGSISARKKLLDLYVLFSKKVRTKARIEAIVDDDRTIDLGEFDKHGAFSFLYVDFSDISFAIEKTFASKQRAMINGFDNIQFKISKIVEDGEISNSSFGIEILQATYQILDN